ncbi:adhesin [Lelliottia nimipressuralis]|uniref:adhesin n=1 Tax=Lelliottia nimipressuralis TaxID=69220 RepID=UPI003B263A7C
MFKNIVIFVILFVLTPFYCSANEPEVNSLDNLIVNSFKVDEIPDLGHPVCTLSLYDNKKDDYYNYVEGSICPVGGEICKYSAIMKINNKINILKEVPSDKNGITFQSSQFYIISKHTEVKESEMNPEGTNIESIISINIKNRIKKFNMTGYCGI